MNTTDELTTLPPPPACRECMHIEERVTLGVERCRCVERRPMHSNCAWFDAKTPTITNTKEREPA